MESYQSLMTLLAGLGLGSVITNLIQHLLTRRSKVEDTRFVERKEAFINLLAAIAELDKLLGDSTNEVEVHYALCAARVKLVASKGVLKILDTWRDYEPDSAERNEAVNSLIEEMRRDLGVSS